MKGLRHGKWYHQAGGLEVAVSKETIMKNFFFFGGKALRLRDTS